MSDSTRDDRRPTRPLLVADLPAPPYPSDAKARGWRFEIDTEQLFASSTWKLALNAGGDVANGLLRMWLESWAQVPAGSMPNEEREIAAIIGVPLMGLQSHRDIFFRHWHACNDGRLYHPVIGGQVIALYEKRRMDRDRKSAWRAANVPQDSTGLPRNPADSNGIQTPEPEPEPEVHNTVSLERGVGKTIAAPSAPAKQTSDMKTPKPKADLRGSRLDPDFELPDEWRDWSIECYPRLTQAEVMRAFVEFRNYWSDVPGQKGLKLRWFQTWQNNLHRRMKDA